MTCFCLEPKGSSQIRWLVLACTSMTKLTFLRASTQPHHGCDAETTLTFLAGGKDTAKAETASSRLRTVSHSLGCVRGLTTRANSDGHSTGALCAPGEHPALGRDATQRLLTKEAWRNASSSASRGHFSCFKGCSGYEIHTGRKTYGKVSEENKRKAAVLPDSHL